MIQSQEQEPPKDFVKGFNEGYLIARELPQFANDMAKFMPDSERGVGFKDGIDQYAKDIQKEKILQHGKDFKASKDDMGIDKNSRTNQDKDFAVSKEDMGINSKDRFTDWLKDKDDNKTEMGIDRDQERDKYKEPEID